MVWVATERESYSDISFSILAGFDVTPRVKGRELGYVTAGYSVG
jgi:hypothetical protein